MKSVFVFIIICCYDFWVIPVDRTGRALLRMFRDARNVFIRFRGRDVITMLLHSRAEIDPRLSDIFDVRITIAILFVNTF